MSPQRDSQNSLERSMKLEERKLKGGKIKGGTTNLKVMKEPERELRKGNALPRCQRGHGRKGKEENKTGRILNLG